jgi:hypothetical protein
MTRSARAVTTCPDCGGILQSTTPERLTSVEVEAGGTADTSGAPRQCLICGYVETSERPAAAVSR